MDTEVSLKGIRVLHKQIEHLIVLVTESLKSSIPQAKETSNGVQNKKQFLLQQCQTVCDWISQFNIDTMDIKRSPEEEMPAKLKPLEEFVQEAMFEGRLPSPPREASAQYEISPQTPNSGMFMDRRRESAQPAPQCEKRIADL